MAITELLTTLRQLPRTEKLKVMQFLLAELVKEEKITVLQQTAPSLNPDYPLRGLPLVVAEDFDQPMPELWEALS
ncbi:hypothetical protein IQ230_23255 [Gloeocapsopsis crepidinum LEGE 06123]|uniref:DUF2281 domain-containing protein n=1 Tax=Gloeocapsopsis crepidinum LEGE 06123 TaxID=588587 RepID=A0ABR9V133_9CHRO|nr:hypothetical protein [Gloeocapsopsis crepidinum]MBE9193208.1 hypothetical protein [Gloeocapsopsis crepidinum LEGE 06123]